MPFAFKGNRHKPLAALAISKRRSVLLIIGNWQLFSTLGRGNEFPR
jgi:hypothetical protein